MADAPASTILKGADVRACMLLDKHGMLFVVNDPADVRFAETMTLTAHPDAVATIGSAVNRLRTIDQLERQEPIAAPTRSRSIGRRIVAIGLMVAALWAGLALCGYVAARAAG